MKVLNLIIVNFNHIIYDSLAEEWRRYMNSNTQVRSLFLVLDPTINKEYILTEDAITLKGTDSYVPGIYEKTIHSMKICLSLPEFSDIDYVIRTNVSSFWIWDRLLKFLSNTPRSNYLSTGHIMDKFGVLSPHGSNFIMSRDIALKFSDEYCISEKTKYPDDIVFGFLCKKYNINIEKYNWCVSTHIIDPEQYHEFIKTIDVDIFTIRNNLLDPNHRILYEKRKYKMLVDMFYK
jgi:hypothetical protein